MQAGVDKWEAAGFLGMSVEMLDRVYGNHHPDHLRQAAHALGYGRRQSLVNSLVNCQAPRAHTSRKSFGGGGFNLNQTVMSETSEVQNDDKSDS